MPEEGLDASVLSSSDGEWNMELDWLTGPQEPESDDCDEDEGFATVVSCHRDENAKRLRPRRKRKSTVVVPRLFKRDIRRYYATMLANVGNSHDYSLFYAFFRTYAVSDFVVKRHQARLLHSLSATSDSCGTAPARNGVHEIHGILSYAHALYCSTQMNPDQVVSVNNVQVVTRPHCGTSRVTFDMEVRFTHLYDIPPVVFMDNVFTVVNDYFAHLQGEEGRTPVANGGAESVATLSTPQLLPHLSTEPVQPVVDPFTLCRQICGRPLRMCAKPLPIIVRAKTILHLDERRRISVVEATDISYQQ